jgi:hypothetical protein
MTAGGGAAQANEPAFLACESFGSVKGRCALQETELSASFDDELDFTVRYSFACRGHAVGIGLATEAEFVPLAYTDAPRTIRLQGLGPLRLTDRDPEQTYRAVLRGACNPVIHELTLRPSLATLTDWAEDAQYQARLIGKALDLYRLSRDVEALWDWDLAKLELARERLQRLVTAFPENPQYGILLRSIESAIANRPPPHTPEEVREAGLSLAQYMKEELLREVARGEAMAKRFDQWQLEIEASLARALARAGEQDLAPTGGES